ncbi:MAG: GMC oxidoreductase [Gemmatimonadaceae bacterium]
MSRVVVVGSGASGVHFALSALRRGHEVVMLDVGHGRREAVRPDQTLEGLKTALPDPVAYFLGPRYGALMLPDNDTEYYGLPPSKDYVFAGTPRARIHAAGFHPLASFAQGGLAEAWTAGVYPFADVELRDFPFSYADLAPHYAEIARRIGVCGAEDDLVRFHPVHEHLTTPLNLDEHSAVLAASYARERQRIQRRAGCWLGRSRIAVLSSSRDAGGAGRGGCVYCGRCLWGCPHGALYTPSITLAECRAFPKFRYVAGTFVSHFRSTRGGHVSHVVAEPSGGGAAQEVPLDSLVLAAGTLSSTRIFLDSVHRHTGEVLTLSGLMDNRQILVPFVTLRMLGQPYRPERYQYHQLALALESPDPASLVHGQITTLKTALAHPIIQRLPFDLRSSTRVFRMVRSALGLVNLNLPDTRRPGNEVTIEPGGTSVPSSLRISYQPAADEQVRIDNALARTRSALRMLGCVVPPGMTHVRPMGASVHYAGTVPMRRDGGSGTTDAECRSRDFPNLYFVDGTTYPFLPAKNITFTLMANAARVAETAF